MSEAGGIDLSATVANLTHATAILAGSYLIGSIPSGYIFARLLRGTDITREGSGHVGGFNTLRSAGLLAALLTVAADLGKGVLAAKLGLVYGAAWDTPTWVSPPAWGTASAWGSAAGWAAACMAVLGHNHMVFLRLRGGKGLAATAGALLVLSPWMAVGGLAALLLFALLLRDTNTGAGVAVILLPFLAVWREGSAVAVIGTAALSAIVITKHLEDFRAYRRGRRKLI